MRRIAFLLYVLVAACHRGGGAGAADDQELTAPEQHPDEHVAMAADHSMGGAAMVSNEDLHMRLTPERPVAPGDSARAAAVLAVMRRELAKYRDVRAAQADGFRNFIPAGAAPVQHFTKLRWAFQARSGLDPARPTSLLYERAADGTLTLVGAMFTAPPQTSDAELDARLPLSVARWHQHINWCLPPLADARRRWQETKDGQPVFGPKSPIATAEACEAVGGRFRPRLFGWMVHVMAFSDGDPWHGHNH
jgi:hypothetical protein